LTQRLDYDLVHQAPEPLFLGELPTTYAQVPAPVVINVCSVYPAVAPPVRVLLSLPFLDVPDESMLPERAMIERFLAGVHVHARQGATYWHCHAGINRASFVSAAYLHLYRGVRVSEAIRTLRERRSPLVLCNPVFERALREWYGGPDEQEFEPFSMDRYLEEVRRHLALADIQERAIRE